MTTMAMISALPVELETQILSRITAKSLAELKTTCKRWYALFKDPKFVKSMFGKAASEVILLMNSELYSVSLDLDALQNRIVPTTELTGKLDDSSFKMAEIFECAGLLLCSDTKHSRVVVWNPCTGQTRSINPRKCYRGDDFYALGYKDDNSSCNNYKILRFCRYYDSKNQLVFENEIYDFSSDSWRLLNADHVTSGNCIIQCHGVSLKGNAYWFATDENNPVGKFILMFDFATEKFRRLPLPSPFNSQYCVDDDEMVALSVVGEDELALMRQTVDNMDSSQMTIWTTDTKLDDAEQVSWTDLLTVGFGDRDFTLPYVTSFLWDEKNQVVVCCDTDMEDDDRTSIYIVGEYIYETIYRETAVGSSLNCPILLAYVPNLVNIQKNTHPKGQGKGKLAAPWGGRLRKRH